MTRRRSRFRSFRGGAAALAIAITAAVGVPIAIIQVIGGGPTANEWVNTIAGASPSRCSPACAYDPAHAYGAFDTAYAAASPGDLTLIKSGNYPTYQYLTRGTSPKAAPAVTFKCETNQACSFILIQLSQNGSNCGCASGSAPSNVVFDGIKSAFFNASTSNASYQPTNISLINSHLTWQAGGVQLGSTGFCQTNQGCGDGLASFNGIDHVTMTNDEIGPGCCVFDGVRFQTSAGIDSSNILLDHVNIHDIYFGCGDEPSYVTAASPCTGYGIGAGCSGNGSPPPGGSQCEHVDAMQTSSLHTFLMKDSQALAAGDQTLFLSCYGAGSSFAMSNIAFIGDVVSTRSSEGNINSGGSGFSIGNNCGGNISGYVHLYYNTIQQNFALYSSPTSCTINCNARWVPGTDVKLIGNIIGNLAPGGGPSACTAYAPDNSTFTPVWQYDEFGTSGTFCSGTGNVSANATFANPTHTSSPYDLRLLGAQSAINGGELTVCPPADLFGTARPVGPACDIGFAEAG